MKKYFFCGLLCLAGSVVFAQTEPVYPSNLDVSAAVEAPPSNIDLLKQALKKPASPSASVQSQPPAGSPSVTETKDNPPSAAPMKPAAAQAASPAPAAKAAVSSAPAAKPSVAGRNKNVSVPQTVSSQKTKTFRQPVKAAVKKTVKPAPQKPAPLELDIEKNNALTQPQSARPETAEDASDTDFGSAAQSEQDAQDALAQEELDYAARMIRQAREESRSGRFIPPSASKTQAPAASAPANKPFNPGDYRPGVQWQRGDSKHFVIYTQKRDGGIGSSNMSMAFETAYATLRRNIPWMMSDKVRVFVYQDHNNYLKYEPNAKAWSRALAYPTRGEIVVYDEPGKQQELKEVFTHELTHIFTQKFFDKHRTGRLMTPAWLDEGLAVYMEDQAYNGLKGGPWANDFKTLNFQRSKQSQPASFRSSSLFGGARTFGASNVLRRGKPVYFLPFGQFMENDSLDVMDARGKAQDWYFQAYAMVRFLLNPAGGASPSNRMQFEQFTRLMAQGEQVRDPRSGFLMRDKNGKPVYEPYSAEKALGRAYRYNGVDSFEDAFWRWANNAR